MSRTPEPLVKAKSAASDARAKVRTQRHRVSKSIGSRWGSINPHVQMLLKLLLLSAVALFFYLLPFMEIPVLDTPKSSFESVLFQPVAISVLLALGLNVVVGHAGLLDLGYVAFYAIGAYTMALLGTKAEWDFWVILPFGIMFAMIAGVLLGLPTLRLRGDYLAIVTLGFGEIIRITARNTEELGGPQGISRIPHPPTIEFLPDIFGWETPKLFTLTFGITDVRSYYWLTLTFIIIIIFLLKRIEKSRVGRAWVAIREDEDAAELMGVSTFKYKLWAFAIGAGVGGLGGVLYASKISSITPDTFSIIVSILILASVVLGGAGSTTGVIVGAILLAYLPERFRTFEEYRVLVFGAALVFMMAFRSKGLIPPRRSPIQDTPAAPVVVEEALEEQVEHAGADDE